MSRRSNSRQHERLLRAISNFVTRESWPDGQIDGIHVDTAEDIPQFLDQIIDSFRIGAHEERGAHPESRRITGSQGREARRDRTYTEVDVERE